jgi:hypothetical protein
MVDPECRTCRYPNTAVADIQGRFSLVPQIQDKDSSVAPSGRSATLRIVCGDRVASLLPIMVEADRYLEEKYGVGVSRFSIEQ